MTANEKNSENALPELPEMAPMADMPEMAPLGDLNSETAMGDLGGMDGMGGIGGGIGGDIPLSERRNTEKGATYKRSIYALPVNVQVVIGTARPTIAELLKLKNDSILEMDKAINDPVDLCIDNRIIARGELVETDPISGSLGLKITEIVDIAEDVLP